MVCRCQPRNGIAPFRPTPLVVGAALRRGFPQNDQRKRSDRTARIRPSVFLRGSTRPTNRANSPSPNRSRKSAGQAPRNVLRTPLGTTASRSGFTPKRAVSCRASACELGKIRSQSTAAPASNPEGWGRAGGATGPPGYRPYVPNCAPGSTVRLAGTSKSARARPVFLGPLPVLPALDPRETSRRDGASAPVQAGRSRNKKAAREGPSPRGDGPSG